MPSNPSLPDGLPEEIAGAIRQLESAAWIDGNIETQGASQGRKIARAALGAAILRHLSAAERCCDSYANENQQFHDRFTAAEAERDALKAQIRTQAMEQLGADAGWELENDQLRAQLSAALARAERVEKALDEACQMQSILLMAGEMTAQERRTARAVALGIAWKIRAALATPAPTEER